MSAEMSLRDHFNELRTRILHIALSVIILTAFCMSFGLKPLIVNPNDFGFGMLAGDSTTPASKNNTTSLRLLYPYPDPLNNIAVQLTSYMKNTLLPPEVQLIQTAPGQAFFSQIYVSMLIGIICSIPIIVREIFGFVSPAFDWQNKKIGIFYMFLPIVSLFIVGIVFSYILVIPFTLDFLYKYGQAIGVATFLNINDFISFVLQIFLGFGIAFQLPIVMYAISLTGIVQPQFWKANFRYALIIMIIFGAIITPDGSGITMWFVALPMIMLYLAGMLAVKRKQDKRSKYAEEKEGYS
jgi:sec-independent protein translocase protein TatC